MPDLRPESQSDYDQLKIGTEVTTPDGEGVVVNNCFRKNTNGGPGAKQYVVRLSDNRIHRYPRSKLMPKEEKGKKDGYCNKKNSRRTDRRRSSL